MPEVGMEHDALAQFRDAANHPLKVASDWKHARKRPVIGLFPMNFPGELAHSAGALPALIQESEDPITVGLSSQFAFYCGYNRSIIDQALRGEFEVFDAIMFGDHCVQLLGSADIIRWEVPKSRILFNQLISSMNAPWAFREARETFSQLREELRQILGVQISDDAIHGSIRIFNTNRRLMRQVYDLRRSGKTSLSARQMQDIVKSSMVMDREDHSTLLRQLLQQTGGPAAGRGNAVPVYLSGHLCHAPKPEILDLIEECGAVVVDDDLYHGYRYIATDVDETGDPIDALTHWYLRRNLEVPCPTRVDKRADWPTFLLRQMETAKARGLIILMAKFCEPHMYFYPEIKEAFEARGIPHLLVETEHEGIPTEGLKTRVETFLEITKRRVAAYA